MRWWLWPPGKGGGKVIPSRIAKLQVGLVNPISPHNFPSAFMGHIIILPLFTPNIDIVSSMPKM